LCRAAEDLLYEAQRDADNVGSIRVEKLINKYGTIKGSLSRLIDLGGETPELVVINLIVSDGDPSRGQRNSLLNAEVKKIGVANAKDENYGHCSVIIMLTDFINKVDENDYGILVGEVIDHSERDRDRLKDDEEEVEEGVVSIDKTETIVEENGKMKKITKIVKNLEDGKILLFNAFMELMVDPPVDGIMYGYVEDTRDTKDLEEKRKGRRMN